MKRPILLLSFLALGALWTPPGLEGQFLTLETDHLRLVYTAPQQSYLVPHVMRAFENSLRFHRELFDYTSPDKINVLMHDLWHYGNAGARSMPHNHITLGLSPYAHVYESAPAPERMGSSMNHEMAHIVTTDKATSTDRFFRSAFFGKVTPNPEEPLTMLYSYLTTPRWYSPRWYLEGIAVYLETWMNGGMGRAIGAYDEMVFRTMVLDDRTIYDIVGLESEGTTIDFQVGVNSYLYGTRFVSYLALRYGNEKLIRWYDRSEDSKRFFSAQFQEVYGISLHEEWSEWIEWERRWQRANLDRIRNNPTTPSRPVTDQALGSVSRAYFDPAHHKVYVAIRYPGQTAHLGAIDIDDGTLEKITDVLGPSGFYVTSLAFDPDTRTLFYTINNRDWRHLVALNLNTGESETLVRNIRVGDLVFNRRDRSLWGIRHDNGFSTLVRIPHPYEEWNQIYTLPYGSDLFDLDLSPDGSTLIGSLADAGGKQRLVKLEVDDLMGGDTEHEVLFDFGNWSPSNFVFSPDGRYLFGSSYYSGVSNIFRYDLAREVMEPLSNAETGFFKPVPVSEDSLLVFRYSGDGFVPSLIPNQVPGAVSAITFLGNEIAGTQPVVQDWVLPSPTLIQIDSPSDLQEPYSAFRNLTLDSAYPILEGYEDAAGADAVAAGLRLNLSDRVGATSLDLAGSYSPDGRLDADERLHLDFRLRHWDWEVTAGYNRADFYDLFGPTKTSRKGYSLGVRYRHSIVFDGTRQLSYTLQTAGYGGLETLPEFQNIRSSFDKLLSFHAGLDYELLKKSLGAVEDESGVTFRLSLRTNVANSRAFPRLSAHLVRGFLLPLNHSSVWLRGSAGTSLTTGRDEPFANFFFGGFGNNWVDYQDHKRFRDSRSLPGIGINEVGGTNFGKVQVEWVLPPLRFRRVGVPSLYLRWAGVSFFAAGLATNVDRDALRRTLVNAGAQIDLRLVTASHMKSTFSLGYGLVAEEGRGPSSAFMISLKIL